MTFDGMLLPSNGASPAASADCLPGACCCSRDITRHTGFIQEVAKARELEARARHRDVLDGLAGDLFFSSLFAEQSDVIASVRTYILGSACLWKSNRFELVEKAMYRAKRVSRLQSSSEDTVCGEMDRGDAPTRMAALLTDAVAAYKKCFGERKVGRCLDAIEDLSSKTVRDVVSLVSSVELDVPLTAQVFESRLATPRASQMNQGNVLRAVVILSADMCERMENGKKGDGQNIDNARALYVSMSRAARSVRASDARLHRDAERALSVVGRILNTH